MSITADKDRLISIVVPVYRVNEAFLRKCVESCLDQTNGNLELILVDDGSPDHCGAVCDEYAARDSRVRVIHQQNQGVSAARNAGIHAASGRWLTFLDADDFLEPDTCEVTAACFAAHPQLDMVVFSMVKEYEDRQVPNTSLYDGDRLITGEDAVASLRSDVLCKQLDRNVLRMTFGKVIRTDILRQHGIRFVPELPLCEDVVFWFHAVQHVEQACYLDRRLYHYRQVDNSATEKYRPDVVREHEILLRSLRQIMDATGTPERYLQGYCLEAFYSMQRIITQGFYHPDNPASPAERAKACAQALGAPLYRDALKQIRVGELTNNHKIKYYLLRLKLYAAVARLRDIYGFLTGRTTEKD